VRLNNNRQRAAIAVERLWRQADLVTNSRQPRIVSNQRKFRMIDSEESGHELVGWKECPMQKHVHPVLLLVLLIAAACGDSPTHPTETPFSLNGAVTGNGVGLAGATVTIMDGVNAGHGRTTDASGNYSFTNLTPSHFTLRAAALDHSPQNKAVNLTTSNQTVSFALVKTPQCVDIDGFPC
jgi:hypothetical protein